MITLKDAILELYKENHSNTGLTLRGEGDEFTDLSGVLLDDGTSLKFTFNDVKKKKTSLQAEYEANEYQRSRASEYPSIPDQLDEIFHNGIDSWKAIIKQTKDKYPKG